jgi:hypothetical protein
MPTATRGSAAAALVKDAADECFFESQFNEARDAALQAARRLAEACSRNAPPNDLDRLARLVSTAASDLRVAILARAINR